jgi:hypothetical protein
MTDSIKRAISYHYTCMEAIQDDIKQVIEFGGNAALELILQSDLRHHMASLAHLQGKLELELVN